MAHKDATKRKAIQERQRARIVAGQSVQGRPKKPLNFKTFEGLCQIQCTTREIAAVLGIHVDTLAERVAIHYDKPYAVVYKEKRAAGASTLRRAQWKSAISRSNPIMQIWLGKNVLGQLDKPADKEVDPDEFAAKTKLALERMDGTISGKAEPVDPKAEDEEE